MESSSQLMNMILTDGSPEEISDKIKEIAYTKSYEIINHLTPIVAQSMFSLGEE